MERSEWTYDASDDTHKIGSSEFGAAVFLDAPLAGDDEEWYGNVVTPSRITLIGPFNCIEDARKCAEERLAEHRNE